MTREDAIFFLNELRSANRCDETIDLAIAAMREIDAMYATDTIGESVVKSLKQDCPYCSWIDPELLEEDEDGPLNFCRVCGRCLRKSE